MTNQTKLYIGCGLTNAPQDFCDDVERLKDKLRGEYEVFDFVGKVGGTPTEVYKWDIEHCVADCDLFIAVCDYDSIGLGWELSEATNNSKMVLAVAHHEANVSRLVLGAAEVKSNFEFRRYENLLNDIPLFAAETLK